jgi:hypothetical protein
VQSGGAPLASADEHFGTPASHVFVSEGTQHVFYRTDDLDVIELWFKKD